jgi:NAD(P)H-hydrate epimerase
MISRLMLPAFPEKILPMSIPTLTRQQVREIDRLAIEEYGIAGVVLMENAGRGCVDVLCRQTVEGLVIVCCGKGNNAGDGYVIARHLDLRGYEVEVWQCLPAAGLQGDALVNYQTLLRSGVTIRPLDDPPNLEQADWIVDALLGTGVVGAPRAPLADVIRRLNAASARKLAIDLPSGLDCETGEPQEPTFRADHTCTFVAAKPGMVGAEVVGELHVCDIGAPRELIRRIELR